MNDASARGPIPVPFADDGFAQYELDRCRADQNSFDQALTIISIAAAATVFFQRIRNKEHRKFPDNIFTMMLVALCGIHLALLISIASQNRVVTEKVQPWMALCELQGRMFHWCSCAAIWNVFCVILTLHRVIVLKIPVAELARHSRLYYASLVGLPTLAVTVCSIFADYGPYPGLHNCWIEPGPGRLLYFHSFTFVTFSACIALGPPTIYALWKAYHNASQPHSVGLFRSLMWRQILLATYGLAVVGTFLVGGINNMLLESHKKSSYIKSTAYPLCIFSAINFASLGLLVSLIYWSTRHQSLQLKQTLGKAANVMCCGRLHHFQTHEFDHDADLENERGGNAQDDKDDAKKSKFSTRHAPVVLSARNVSPRSPSFAREPLRSAFDSDGRSVTSVPPDPQHRAAHQVATNAYTSTLLEYVREQLLDELEAEDDSDFSSAYDDESDTRSSLASNRRSSLASNASALERFSRGSYPTTPQANFHHDVSPRQERISDHRDLVVNRRATITEL